MALWDIYPVTPLGGRYAHVTPLGAPLVSKKAVALRPHFLLPYTAPFECVLV